MADKKFYIDIDAKSNVFIGGGLASPSYTARLRVQGSGTTTASLGLYITDLAGVPSLQVDDAGNVWNTGKGQGNNSTAFGYLSNVSGTGDGNTTIGDEAGRRLTTGSGHTIVGHRTGEDITTGTFNSLFGMFAGLSLDTGSNNCIFGVSALQNATSSSQNVGIGRDSLLNLEEGLDNVGIGGSSLRSLNGASAANESGNTALGRSSLSDLTTGDDNTAIGNVSGTNIISGVHNTFIGSRSGSVPAVTTVSNSIAIGYNVQVNKDNQMVVGNQGGGSEINEVVWGAGAESNTGINPTVHVHKLTDVVGTDITPDYEWEWHGAIGVGNGPGSGFSWKVAPAGAPGSTQNALITAFRIYGANGYGEFGTRLGVGVTPTTHTLQVQGQVGENLIQVGNTSANNLLTLNSLGQTHFRIITGGGVSIGNTGTYSQINNAILSVRGNFSTSGVASFGNAITVGSTVHAPGGWKFSAGPSHFMDDAANLRTRIQTNSNRLAITNSANSLVGEEVIIGTVATEKVYEAFPASASQITTTTNILSTAKFWDGAASQARSYNSRHTANTDGTSDVETTIDGTIVMTLHNSGVVQYTEFSKTALPTAVAGGVIIVTDDIGGRTLATSDGTQWLRVSDGAVVS